MRKRDIIFRDKNLNKTQSRLFWAIHNFARNGRSVFKATKVLSLSLGINERSLYRHIAYLESINYIERFHLRCGRDNRLLRHIIVPKRSPYYYNKHTSRESIERKRETNTMIRTVIFCKEYAQSLTMCAEIALSNYLNKSPTRTDKTPHYQHPTLLRYIYRNNSKAKSSHRRSSKKQRGSRDMFILSLHTLKVMLEADHRGFCNVLRGVISEKLFTAGMKISDDVISQIIFTVERHVRLDSDINYDKKINECLKIIRNNQWKIPNQYSSPEILQELENERRHIEEHERMKAEDIDRYNQRQNKPRGIFEMLGVNDSNFDPGKPCGTQQKEPVGSYIPQPKTQPEAPVAGNKPTDKLVEEKAKEFEGATSLADIMNKLKLKRCTA